jgi:hypothetical protein
MLSAQITDAGIKAQAESDDGEVVLEIDINRLSGHFKHIWLLSKSKPEVLSVVSLAALGTDGDCHGFISVRIRKRANFWKSLCRSQRDQIPLH